MILQDEEEGSTELSEADIVSIHEAEVSGLVGPMVLIFMSEDLVRVDVSLPISQPEKARTWSGVQYTWLYPHMRIKLWAHMRTTLRRDVRIIN